MPRIISASSALLTPVSFRVGRNSNYSHTSGNAVGFNKTSGDFFHNIGGHYNSSNGRFTVPFPGRYIFHCCIIWQDIPNNEDMTDSWRFGINGNQKSYSERRSNYVVGSTGGGGYFTDFGSDIFDLAQGDYVTVIGKRTRTIHGNEHYCRFSGAQLV